MRLGDVIEVAIWVDGREASEHWDQFKADVAEQMGERTRAMGYALTPLRWAVKRPGDERVPEVPPHIDGPDVRLLVAEATVMPAPSGNFLAELEARDLVRLRKITREAYARAWREWREDGKVRGRMPRLTDRQADTLINDIGPEAALSALSAGQVTIQ